ncbi:MAG TPA: BlaI/MecI/CopY family transcriptional regulator [Pirellulales bacterium]|jgi:BlaI family penicillinase repressor|nr:BlaI/MecI/CopY family transcriptional regulator [Pirellulales bacterium]
MTRSGKKSTKASRPELSRLELAVMDTVWKQGQCSSAEVIAAFQKQRPLAPTTIRTVLANLRKKHYIEPVPAIERGFRWKASVSRSTVARRTLREMLKNLFQGSPRQAIACLLCDETISDDEMREIRQLLEDRTAGKKRSP